MTSRTTPFHCPFCGDTDLWPASAEHGAWECHSCLRAFELKSLGIIERKVAVS